jgi:uncharacterized protein (DUF305 family)
MMRKTWRSYAAVALVLSTSGCAARNVEPERPDMTYDERFLRETIRHLNEDLRIAAACPGKNIRSELMQFCGQLGADQEKERKQLATWLQDWFKDDVKPDHHPLWIEKQDGTVFEKHFIEGVLRGHRDLAERAASCTREAEHAELRTFCQEVTAHRAEEAQQLENWQCAWFEKCD